MQEGSSFEHYLLDQGLSENTIRTYQHCVARLLAWLVDEGLEARGFAYGELLSYVQHVPGSGASARAM